MSSSPAVFAAVLLLTGATGLGQQAVASLPDTTYNVGVEDILAPRGTIDSGQTIIPSCVVANYGDSTASPWVLFGIDDGTPHGYLDSLWIPSLAPAQRETLTFGVWVPHGRDSMEAIAWTVCAGDTFPADDTCRVRFLVRVYDLHLMLMLPDTLYDSIPILPRARVWNYSNLSVDGYLEFRVDSTYYSRRDVHLIPGGSTVVAAADSWYPVTCLMACSLFILPPDICVAWDIDTVIVRGHITKDVDVRAILTPGGVVDTTIVWTPRSRYGNNGVDAASFEAYYLIFNQAGSPVYADSQPVLLGAGDSIELDFSNVRLSTIGMYTAACSVYMAGDQNSTNDVMRRRFRVVARVSGDIGITVTNWPHDTLDTLTVFYPWCKVKNFGAEPDSGCVALAFWDSTGRLVYEDSVFFGIEGGEEYALNFDSVRFTTLGRHVGRSRFWLISRSPDTTEWEFWVVPFVPGVEESAKREATSHKPQATVLRMLPKGTLAFDATGRRVLNPKSGILFVQERIAVGGERSTVHVRKVILQR